MLPGFEPGDADFHRNVQSRAGWRDFEESGVSVHSARNGGNQQREQTESIHARHLSAPSKSKVIFRSGKRCKAGRVGRTADELFRGATAGPAQLQVKTGW